MSAVFTAFKQWQTHKKVSRGNHNYNIVFEALFQWFSDVLKSWLQQSKQTTDNVHLKHKLNNFPQAFTIVDKMLMTSDTLQMLRVNIFQWSRKTAVSYFYILG